MSITIRAERPGDESAINVVNYLAFEPDNREKHTAPGLAEADLVHLLRTYYPRYSRDLSIVAWDGERPVGHALLTPCDIRLLGETVRALAVGPVAVVPEYQGRGIGALLMAEGHDVGRATGSTLAFLCGHASYYPRLGYVACHGFGEISIDADRLPAPSRQFSLMPVQPEDCAWLSELCRREWEDVDFGWLYGDALTEWHAPGMISHVWRTGSGQRVAYSQANPWRKWRFVLAEDPEIAQEVLATIRPDALEQHPSGHLARSLAGVDWCTASGGPSDACMAYPLQDGALDPLLAALDAGRRPGCANWPIPFALIP